MHLLLKSLTLLLAFTALEAEEIRRSLFIFDLPLEQAQDVIIHRGPEDAYAVDFISTSPGEGKILAARQGIVLATSPYFSPDLSTNRSPVAADWLTARWEQCSCNTGPPCWGTRCGDRVSDLSERWGEMRASSQNRSGHWIAIQHEFHEVSFYESVHEIYIQVGDEVERGQVIASEGPNGIRFSVFKQDHSEEPPLFDPSHYANIPFRLQYLQETIHVVDIRDVASGLTQLFHMSYYQHPLLTTLRDMKKEDQEACRLWIDAPDEEKETYGKRAMEIRRKHHPLLKEIVKEYGWPPYSIIGAEGCNALWILVQHQDEELAFQKECLALLKEAVDQNQANFTDYAYLLDRVRTHENLPQVYGTQWIIEQGKYMLYPVENPEELEKRRADADMPTIEEYKNFMQEVYHLTDEDFK